MHLDGNEGFAEFQSMFSMLYVCVCVCILSEAQHMDFLHEFKTNVHQKKYFTTSHIVFLLLPYAVVLPTSQEKQEKERCLN